MLFFLIYNIIIVIIFACLCNSVKHILEFNYFQGKEGQLFHYYQMLLQSVCTKCRLQTAHRRCWTVVPRPINISALMMRVKRNFSRVASVISRPATCLVSIAGKHFFGCQWKLC